MFVAACPQVTRDRPKQHVSTSQYKSVQVSTSQYESVKVSTSQYKSVQVSTSQYKSVRVSTSQYESVQVNTSQYKSVWVSTSQYESVQVSTSQSESVRVSTSQYKSQTGSDKQPNMVLIGLATLYSVTLTLQSRVGTGVNLVEALLHTVLWLLVLCRVKTCWVQCVTLELQFLEWSKAISLVSLLLLIRVPLQFFHL
jgi:hypothetical protein